MRAMLCAAFRGLWHVVANIGMLLLMPMLLMMMTPSHAVTPNLNLTLNMVLAPNQTYEVPFRTQLNFGTSVAFWRTNGEMKLVVGAPLTPYSVSLLESVPLGNVFLCTLEGLCGPDHRLHRVIREHEHRNEVTVKLGMGLGETLAFTSPSNTMDSTLLVCAPRFTMYSSSQFEPRGACFRFTDSNSKPDIVIPFKDGKWGYHRMGFGMAGFSAALTKDEHVFMGMPGAFYWQGLVSSRNLIGHKPYKYSKEESADPDNDDSYEGWALALGRFSGETNQEYIAASVPFANNTNEQIKFWNKDFVRLEPRYSSEEASTRGFRSYYGYALAVGDLDKDGNDDLIVGAPMAKGKNGVVEGGKVFVYYGPLNNRLVRKTQILEGSTAWSRFGTAIVSDDFNRDGYYDVAVGAPYSRQGWGGAVYIYMGGKDGLCETTGGICHTPAMVICASDFSPPSPGSQEGVGLRFLHTASIKQCKVPSSSPLRSLGYSLATADADDNGYPDLLIGAPSADKALLIRSAPVVVLKGDIFFEPTRFLSGNIACTSTDKTGSEKVICFKLKINIRYEAHQLDIQNLGVVFKINLDYKAANKRIFFRDNNEAEIEWSGYITKTEPTTELDVYVKPEDVEYVEKITCSLIVQLADQPQESDTSQQMDPVPLVLYNPNQVFVAHGYWKYVEDCDSKKACGDCIQTHGCKWCIQLSTAAKGKCFAADADFIGKCVNTTSANVENSININQFAIMEDLNLSGRTILATPTPSTDCQDTMEAASCADGKSKGLCPVIGREVCKKTCGFCPLPEVDSGVDIYKRLVQLKPQRIKLKLQKDVPLNITVKYRQAKDYPIDLYYLMDLSKSMEKHKTAVAGLMSKIVDTLRQHTKQVRLGFGSFVDKALFPYASMSPIKLAQPCPACGPVYSFRNNIPLNDNFNSFKEQLDDISMSGNLDAPEGGFDALMQVMKCTDQIGWSENARRIIVFSTDAKFHSAGDGKLAGIIEKNDEQCHLNDQGEYTHYKKLDYPSVAQINAVAKEEQFNILFAVTEHESLYEILSNEIESSSYGKLSNASQNIVELLEDQYLALTSKVELKHNTEDMDGSLAIEYFARCPGAPENTFNKTSTCHNIHDWDEIEFKLQVTLQKYSNEHNFEVKVGTTEEKLVIEVETLCDCNCQEDSQPVIDLF